MPRHSTVAAGWSRKRAHTCWNSTSHGNRSLAQLKPSGCSCDRGGRLDCDFISKNFKNIVLLPKLQDLSFSTPTDFLYQCSVPKTYRAGAAFLQKVSRVYLLNSLSYPTAKTLAPHLNIVRLGNFWKLKKHMQHACWSEKETTLPNRKCFKTAPTDSAFCGLRFFANSGFSMIFVLHGEIFAPNTRARKAGIIEWNRVKRRNVQYYVSVQSKSVHHSKFATWNSHKTRICSQKISLQGAEFK